MATAAHYNWVPSTTRVVVVDGFGPFPRGSLQMSPTPLIWPAKDPADLLDFVVDYREALAGNCGDTIATLDISISPSLPGDLSLAASNAEGTLAILWLSGGQVGTTYSITVIVGTSNGRSIARTVALPVMALATPATSNTALTDQLGMPLTDQYGAVLNTT